MSRVKVLGGGLAAMLAAGMVLAAGASAGNPCKPNRGVSPCVFGIQTTPEGPPEPLRVGQTIQAEWWGRGSYFNAGRYSFLCHDVVFGGTVQSFLGGAPVFSTPATDFMGGGSGGACTSVSGDVQVSAPSADWTIQLSVKSTGASGYEIKDQLGTSDKKPVSFAAVYSEPGLPAVDCTWTAKHVKGTSSWVADEQIQGLTPAQAFKLDTEATNSPQCPASGKLETHWRFDAAPPAGGLLPVVLAIG
jgi:hypothetical protein